MNAEEQGSQVQQRMNEKDFFQTPQVDVPWMRKRILHWMTVGICIKKKKQEKKRETAKERTREPLKSQVKGGEEGKKDRKSDKCNRTRKVLGKSGRLLLLFVLLTQKRLCVDAAAEGVQKRTEMMER